MLHNVHGNLDASVPFIAVRPDIQFFVSPSFEISDCDVIYETNSTAIEEVSDKDTSMT